jgi:hypothetical protein
MPNWCENKLTVKHDNPEDLQKFVDAWNSGELLQTLLPCPLELRDTKAGYMGDSEDVSRQYAKELHLLKEQLNIKTFGYKNWYDWCVNEWGTKWDIGRSSERDNDAVIEGKGKKQFVEVSFDSAWSPPVEAYHKLTDMGYQIDAYYYEPGMAFCGSFNDGIEDTYKIEGNASWARKNIPAHILDAFNIIELMESYEEEV